MFPNYVHNNRNGERRCPAIVCGTCMYPTDKGIPAVQTLATVFHSCASRHVLNLRCNDCLGCGSDLKYHHTVWDWLKMSTTGEWFDNTKQRIQSFSQYLQVARTHTAAQVMAGGDLQEIALHPPMANALFANEWLAR